MKCEEKGFIVEVAGIDNPATPPFILSTSPKGPGKPWCRFAPAHGNASPHTLYAAEFTEQEAEAEDWKLYLQVPGVENPLQVAPCCGQAAQSPTGVLPTGYKRGVDAFQEYIFIPFRPVTSILGSRHGGEYNYLGYGESGGQVPQDGDEPQRIKCHLRLLRKGYLYIFCEGRLWREIEVFEDGTFTDIDLEKERPERAVPRRQDKGNEQGPKTGSAKEIWIPFRSGPQKGAQARSYGTLNYHIAYSEQQWSWPYIEWLENDEKHYKARMDTLDPLFWNYVKNAKNEAIPPRFASFIGEAKSEEKYFPVELARSDVLTEAVGDCRRLVNSKLWKDAEEQEYTPTFSGMHIDWRIFSCLYRKNVPPVYEEIKYGIQKTQGAVFGAGVSRGRGLFLVNDYLYSPLFYAARVNFYFDMLKGFDLELIKKPYAATLWQILDSSRNIASAQSLYDYLDMQKLERQILPRHRNAVQKLLEESLEDLSICLSGDSYSSYGDRDLPGSRTSGAEIRKKTSAALHDLFALDGISYIYGWSWVKNIASALAIDPELADSCHLKPSTRVGRRSFLSVRRDSILRTMEDWDCNGLRLRDMMYPKLSDYPVDTPLRDGSAIENDGSGNCRFEELRSVLKAEKNAAARAQFVSVIAGAGAIFYQAYLEEALADSIAARNHERLQYPVNLFRLANMETMILSSVGELELSGSRVLVKGTTFHTAPEEYRTKTGYVRKKLPGTNNETTEEYLIRQVDKNKYIACRANRDPRAKLLPLLVMPKDDPALLMWSVGVGATAQVVTEMSMLFIVISGWNLMVCREAWISGETADAISLALKAAAGFAQGVTGVMASGVFWQAAKAGVPFSTAAQGTALAAKGLRIALKAGNILGFLDNGYNAVRSGSRGDNASAAWYGAGATACLLALGVGIAASGGIAAVAAPALGILGLGGGVLGGYYASTDLQYELRRCVYGKEARPVALPGTDVDDNVFRLLRYASPIDTGVFNPADELTEYHAHARFLGLNEKLFSRKAIRISWPMFSQPFETWQINCPYGGVGAYLYIEDSREMILFTEYEIRKIIIWHNGQQFAYLKEISLYWEDIKVDYLTLNDFI